MMKSAFTTLVLPKGRSVAAEWEQSEWRVVVGGRRTEVEGNTGGDKAFRDFR